MNSDPRPQQHEDEQRQAPRDGSRDQHDQDRNPMARAAVTGAASGTVRAAVDWLLRQFTDNDA